MLLRGLFLEANSGDAIAITHPLGMTVRQVVTGLAELQRKDGKILYTSMVHHSFTLLLYFNHPIRFLGSDMGAAGLFDIIVRYIQIVRELQLSPIFVRNINHQ